MTNSNVENTAASRRYRQLEDDCVRQHIYPLYRVLEEEYKHQHGALPDEYLKAKERIDREVEEQLTDEINAELESEIEREAEADRRAAHRRRSRLNLSEEELHRRAVQQIECSFEERRKGKQKRYVVLLNEKFTAELYKHIHALPEKRTALCFSGGGIRSASFGLGIVQGLARYGLLERFDYLSTVSGGGYLGSWLSAWIHRSGLPDVITALRNEPEKNKLTPEPEPIRHLRSYSNYLNPKLGFLSADTWTLVSIVVRNLLLNWLVLIPIILAALMLPRIVVGIVRISSEQGRLVSWSFWLGMLFGLAAIVYMGVARPSANRPRKIALQRVTKQGAFLWLCLLPLSLSAICLTSWWAWGRTLGGESFGESWLEFVIYGAVLHFIGYVLYTLVLLFKDFRFWKRRWARNWVHLASEPFAVVLIGILWGTLVWWAANIVFPEPAGRAPVPVPVTELYASFAAPLFLCLFLLAVVLFVGITSHYTDDEDREWWARFGAWVLIVSLLWSVVSALVIFGPVGLMYLGTKTQAILAALGGASGILTILGGKSGKSQAHPEQEEKSGGLADYAMKLAAPLFALTLLIVFSLGTSMLIRKLAPESFDWHDMPGHPYADMIAQLNTVHYAPLGLLVVLALVLVALSLVMSSCVNVNKFSLHSMYRNRLIRAYMGASRPQSERRPNPFTGFDAYDNLPMHELRHYQGAPHEPKRKLMHVVNICLNLTSGHNLAWQQRKAETFTVSPLHSGSFQLGYRKTQEYGGGSAPPGDGISLGTAVTISGAAASPNMGYHSSPALAFLMTLFNARLGWWLGNPGPAGNDRFSERLHTYNRSGPRFALRPILAEALGHSDNTSPYVYLSDGGHFENLGLYEMVLRRAHLIVVADGSQDPKSRFEDLAGAVRKIRIDLGIPIDFIGGMPIYTKEDKEHRDKGEARYSAIGLIRYSCADKDTSGQPAKDGVIIYIKPAITGGEPIDILNYASTSRTFPHESTADQNYTEQQLESYRALGSHVIQTICDLPLRNLPLMDDVADNFVKLAYQQAPLGKIPLELKGRFNIP
ncbi:MAG TPA: patatin-like phospholipase family protein [Pyrinomonadaceae bacterium]|nr:patatin-like phospholipase family protein [Pyrinomonadaceae bacterium]